MKLARKVGAVSQILQVFIQDSSSTTGAGLTGLVFNSGSLTAYYHRDTDTTATAITLVTMTVGAFTSSGFKEIDATNMPGWYQFCPPNAALASGASSVGLHLKGATNMAPLPIEIDLSTQADVTSWNGTAVATPATAGIPDVNTKNVGNTAQTGRDLGASVLLSSGVGTGQVSLSAGLVSLAGTQTFNVTGNITGNLSGTVGSVTGAVGSVVGLTAANLDAAISTRMATYAQPAGFLAATFPGVVASPTNITAGTITTATSVTNPVTVGTVNASATNIKKNAAAVLSFPMTDSTTHVPVTGKTVAATRSIDGAAFGACANAVTEISVGVYTISLAAADTNGNTIMYRFTAAACDDRLIEIITQP